MAAEMTEGEALRAYVLAGTDTQQKAPEGQVRLDVISEVLNSSPTNSANNWKNFPLNLTVEKFKQKLELFVGTSPQYMVVEIYDPTGSNLVARLEDDSKLLESFNIQNGMRVFVKDVDPNNTIKQLQDTSLVEKYTLSDDAYNQKEGTYRKWKEEQKAKTTNNNNEAEEAYPQHIKVGDRCECETVGGGMKRRGTVMFVGKVDFGSGYWVGVKLDEPLGKNDGSVKGKRYFDCPDKYGSFVKPNKITVGDFPERDILDEDDEI